MATQLRTPYIFNPIDENAQRFLCSLVDLPLIFPHARKISKPLNKPIKLYNIISLTKNHVYITNCQQGNFSSTVS